MPTITTHTFYGGVENIASGMIPRVYGRSYAIEAELSVPGEGAEGVIVAEADEMGGFSLWVDENGLLHHSYSMMGVEQYEQVSTEPIPDRGRHGPHAVRLRPAGTVGRRNGLLVRKRREDRRGADREDGRRPLLRVTPAWTSAATTACPSTAPTRRKSPYPFTGTVKKVIFDLKPGTHEDEKALHEGGAHVAAAQGISA